MVFLFNGPCIRQRVSRYPGSEPAMFSFYARHSHCAAIGGRFFLVEIDWPRSAEDAYVGVIIIDNSQTYCILGCFR